MPGRVYRALFEVATEQYGYVTTDDARNHGVDAQRLRLLAQRGDLRRVAHGLYRFDVIPVTMLDQLMEATLWPRGLGVISHDTALDLWDLCDVNPHKVDVTIPKAARIRRAIPAPYRVYVRDLDAEDVTYREGVRVVTPRRAIIDGVEAETAPHLIRQAVETATGRGLLSPHDVVTLNA